jgi:uncharacterized protein (TIGR03435 family)
VRNLFEDTKAAEKKGRVVMIPNSLSAIWAATAPAMGNHLWQSTLCLVVAGLLTLILRKNRARARYGLWLAASVKFLIPFSLLIAIGSSLARPRVLPPTEPGFFLAMQEISQPFAPSAAVVSPVVHSATFPNLEQLIPAILVAAWFCGFVVVLSVWYGRWRRASAAMREAVPLREGREVETLRRLERLGGIRKPIELLLSPANLEPGVFGIVRPVLLWPKGISGRLDGTHLEAILAHEVWHVRHRDNLAAAIHMVVEALFWFHPLVWWLGSRLVDERERACDEQVLELGSERQVYAEGILKTCEFCVESPLACVSGVAGADLKKRVVRIMTERWADKLSFSRKLLLAAIGLAAVAGPVVFGLVNAPSIRAQSQQTTGGSPPSIESASVKRNRAGDDSFYHFRRDRISIRNLPPEMLIELAYGYDFGDFGFRPLRGDHLVGGPMWVRGWISSKGAEYEGYDLDAKVDESLAEKFGKDCGNLFDSGSCGYRHEMMLMLQSLLADRFKLKVRWETRQDPVYALVIAHDGPKFLHTTFALPPPPCPAEMYCFQHYTSMARMADWLWGGADFPVIDQTGLQGGYYINLQWPRNPSVAGTHIAPQFASKAAMFAALPQQLGLELEPTQGPEEFLVIDHIERPSEN